MTEFKAKEILFKVRCVWDFGQKRYVFQTRDAAEDWILRELFEITKEFTLEYYLERGLVEIYSVYIIDYDQEGDLW